MAAYNKHNISCSLILLYFFCGYLSLTAAVKSSGKFSLLYAPKYVKFLESADPLNTEEIPSVILSTLGLPLTRDIKWTGLAEGNLFRRPKANVLVSVLETPDSEESFVPRSAVTSYTTTKSDGFLDSDAVIDSIQRENWKEEPLYVDFSSISLIPSIRSSSESQFSALSGSYLGLRDTTAALPEFFTKARLGALAVSQDADLELIGELVTILNIVKSLESEPSITRHAAPDFLNFHVSGLQTIQSTYGHDSAQLTSAKQLLNDFVTEITQRFKVLYNDAVVVELVTVLPPSDETNLIRKSRATLEAADSANNQTLNLAPVYTNLYTPIFNICLWFMIVFGLAIFGVSWGMWNMDPGRDSLIYRMTSQRMKRD